MRTSRLSRTAFGVIGVLCVTSPAFAYTPQWLECSGEQAITTAGATTKQPATDIYVYDPDARNLFKYSDSQKRLAYLGARHTSDQTVQWSGSSSGIESTQWDGKLDRSTMSLQLSYKSGPESRIWSESCKPTDPRPES